MKCQKKAVLPVFLTMTILACGTLTVFANSTDTPNIAISQENENCIILGKDAKKESDGIAKISFDLGKSWINQSEILYSENTETEYWTYDEYKVYAEIVEQDLVEMLANGEPNVTQGDIQSWRKDAAQVLELIKNGGKVSKNTISEDSQLMVSADNLVIGFSGQ